MFSFCPKQPPGMNTLREDALHCFCAVECEYIILASGGEFSFGQAAEKSHLTPSWSTLTSSVLRNKSRGLRVQYILSMSGQCSPIEGLLRVRVMVFMIPFPSIVEEACFWWNAATQIIYIKPLCSQNSLRARRVGIIEVRRNQSLWVSIHV